FYIVVHHLDDPVRTGGYIGVGGSSVLVCVEVQAQSPIHSSIYGRQRAVLELLNFQADTPPVSSRIGRNIASRKKAKRWSDHGNASRNWVDDQQPGASRPTVPRSVHAALRARHIRAAKS